MREGIRALCGLALVLGFAVTARATTIFYEVTNVSGSTWRYDYTVVNDTLASDLEEFTIWFDLGLAENLANPMAPADWDPIAIQPDPGLPDDGFYDALALVVGIAPGASLGGFSVEFDFLGGGTPGAQAFDVVDAFDPSVLLDTGTTTPIPEPGTALLVGAGLAGLARSGRRRGSRSSPRRRTLRLGLAIGLAVGAAAPVQSAETTEVDVASFALASRARVDRFHFAYTYDVTFLNTGVRDFTGAIGYAWPTVSGVENDASQFQAIGDLPAGTPVILDAWLTMIVDRRSSFDPDDDLTWRFFVDGFPIASVDPNPLDFGAPGVGCSTQSPVQFRNDGDADLVVDVTQVQPDPTGAITLLFDPASGPWTLQAGQARKFWFEFDSVDTQPKSADLTFSTNDTALPEVAVSVVGAGTPAASGQDSFVQNDASNDKIDILFTLDRSASMFDNLTSVVANFDPFVEELVNAGGDFHLAAAVGDSGCVVGPDPFIDNSFSAAAAQAAFETMVDIDFMVAPYGNNTERGFMLAEAALSNVDPVECNEGFLREDARLATVHVSDEPEQSVQAWSSYVAFFQSLKANPEDAVVNAVAGDYPAGCPTANAGTGYFEATADTSGLFLSICTADWGAELASLAGGLAAGVTNTFLLSATPVPGSVTVQLDGVQQSVGFAEVGPYLVFEAGSVPPAGSSIDVDYSILSCP